MLFELDLNRQAPDKVFKHFWEERECSEDAREFAEKEVRGVIENIKVIDETITRHTEHWDIGRMGVVDRNVLRMSIYEMLFRDDIPPVVSINEGVDLAKYFSSTESGRFVNGILDHVKGELERPARG